MAAIRAAGTPCPDTSAINNPNLMVVRDDEPDIDTDLLAPLHLSSSCREDSLRDVHEHLH
jgi:hypothetical protein